MNGLNFGNFIWNIADDVLRDVYVRGKYRDVILPMAVIRRLDVVLEPSKDFCTENEGATRQGRRGQPAPCALPSVRRGVLQHFSISAFATFRLVHAGSS